MKVFVMRGIPGVGKSTYANSLAQENNCKVISIDDFFLNNGIYKFDKSCWSEAHNHCLKRFIEIIVSGEDVVVDNANTTVKGLIPYLAIASCYNASIEVITLDINYRDLVKISQRNIHSVPIEDCELMLERLKANMVLPEYYKIKQTYKLISL